MTSAQELAMFGCSVAALRQELELSLTTNGPSMAIISMLSDVQELIDHVAGADIGDADQDRLELARQIINRAKFGIMEYLRNS